MATIIPSGLPSTASAGERRLHQILATLPDDCFVYYEPLIKGRHPDFVVIVPQLGVLVVEVKGWYAARLRHLNESTVTYLRDGRPVQESSPEKQVRDYLFRLMDEARNHRWSERLLHQDGPRKGKFRFPFAALVVLSNISEASLKEHHIDREDWDRLFPPDRTLMRDQVTALEALRGTKLLQALRPFITPSWSFPPLREQEMNALCAVVRPQITIGNHVDIRKLETDPKAINDQQDVLQVLDANQQDHAAALGEGHRIIYGVAGSGKTLILLARAKHLAESGDSQIFITCYNRRLAEWIGRELHDYPNITVQNFHAWAYAVGVNWQQDESEEQLGIRLLDHLENQSGTSLKYDSVLVDEAQDFEPNWFRCLLAAMTDPENGDLLIVADGCQSLYRRHKVNWSHLGIKARGRTVSSGFRLDRNYRNSREIIALAESFAYSASDSEDIDAIQEVRVNMARCERTSGVSPLLVECADRSSELLQAYQIIHDLRQGSWNGRPVGIHMPSEIAILYPGATELEKEQLQKFADWMNRKGIPLAWLNKASGARDQLGREAVNLQTIHSAKGLQYRAVIVLWADKLPHFSNQREELLGQRRLLYVAMTRAVSLLAITASRRSAFIDEIAGTPAVEILAQHEQRKGTMTCARRAIS
ncbi:MAG: NERD domain-containing protein/DEAD/DEAH box helicase [Verrucomicrobiales bacterium]